MNLSKPEKHAVALLLMGSPLVRDLPRGHRIMCALETRGVVRHEVSGWQLELNALAVAETAAAELRKEGT